MQRIDAKEEYINGNLVIPNKCFTCLGCTYYCEMNGVRFCYSFKDELESVVKQKCEHYIGIGEDDYEWWQYRLL